MPRPYKAARAFPMLIIRPVAYQGERGHGLDTAPTRTSGDLAAVRGVELKRTQSAHKLEGPWRGDTRHVQPF